MPVQRTGRYGLAQLFPHRPVEGTEIYCGTSVVFNHGSTTFLSTPKDKDGYQRVLLKKKDYHRF